ncbi:hypothetical protein DVH05_004854 [Phytophthora capsici]|nr:hypothetical protein DVH05_004854 [Phytophthora capsici]
MLNRKNANIRTQSSELEITFDAALTWLRENLNYSNMFKYADVRDEGAAAIEADGWVLVAAL